MRSLTRSAGALVRLSTDTLAPADGYWMTAQENLMPARQWTELVACLRQTVPT